MKIDKELFCKCIRALCRTDKFQWSVLELIRDINKKGEDGDMCDMGAMMYPDCSDALLELLEAIMDDNEDEWISYFCYELDFGNEWCEGCCTDEKGNDIPLQTIDDLWNVLTKK